MNSEVHIFHWVDHNVDELHASNLEQETQTEQEQIDQPAHLSWRHTPREDDVKPVSPCSQCSPPRCGSNPSASQNDVSLYTPGIQTHGRSSLTVYLYLVHSFSLIGVTYRVDCPLFSHRIKYHVSLSVAALTFDLISLNSSVWLLHRFPPYHKSQPSPIFCSEKASQAHKKNSTRRFLLHANTNRFVHLQQLSLLISMGRKSP